MERIVDDRTKKRPRGRKAGANVERLKLLIIEDDADQLELMRETLEDYFGRGTVTGIGTAGGALALPVNEFDLILLDYNLPDGSGMDVLETIVQRCTTPVLM